MTTNEPYPFRGEMCSIGIIARKAGVSVRYLKSQLENGIMPEEAVALALEERQRCTIDPKWKGKALEVVFREPLSSVKKDMQPRLNTKYIATPGRPTTGTTSVRPNYLIRLENGKPLIVYPGEFEVIGETGT